MTAVMTADLPEVFWSFLRESCGVPAGAWQHLPAADLPAPARQLLDHPRDMTSTLADFHGDKLRVEVLQQQEAGGLYLREVYLRTQTADTVVEYGVIAIALDQFEPAGQEAIRAGRKPLGALLHEFGIPFVSAPIGFFTITAGSLARTPLGSFCQGTCHGRFNCLSTPAGTPFAWIMEILPQDRAPAPTRP